MIEPAGSALRVGLLLERREAPRWVHEAVRCIQAIPEAQIVLLLELISVADPSDKTHPSGGWGHAAYEAYRRLEAGVFRGHPDFLEESDLGPLLSGCPILKLRAPERNGEIRLGEEDLRSLRSHDLDVLLDLRWKSPPLRAEEIARHGVWSYRHGATPRLAERPPGFREVPEGKEPLFSALVSDDKNPPRLLYASWSTLHKRSVHRTLDQSFAKLAQFPARALRRLGDGERPPAAPQGVSFEGPYRPSPPRNAEVGRAVARLAVRFARDKLSQLWRREAWRIAYGLGKEGLAPRPDRTLPPAPGHFWADPFPVVAEDGYWIFFEEAPVSSQLGHLSVMPMDRAGRCGTPRVILKTETHLSYPGIYRLGSEWYLLPESAEARSVLLYRATHFPFEWTPVELLLEGVRAYDPTLAQIDGLWWMFVNLAPEGGSSWDELHLFHADRPQGPWRPHRRNPVVSDARSARPAGHLFEHRGAWYRPGQDCSLRYGGAVVVNRILRIDTQEYEEVEAARIQPDWDPRVVAVHTLNRAGSLTVLDCIYRTKRWGERGDRREGKASGPG